MTQQRQIGRVAAVILAAVIVPLAMTVAADQDGTRSRGRESARNNVYVVQMIQPPVVAYGGGIDGLRATRPGRGQKINPNSAEVLAYAAYLQDRHDEALNAVGGGRKLYDYSYTFNGFAAEMTEAQADALRSVSGVAAVTKDELQFQDTSSTPDFLGLTAPGGLWDQLGGRDKAGEGIIIGIVDSGIWPESLSFSDRTGANGNASKDGKLDYQQIPGWHGRCKPGEAFPASLCNQKLIGAQWFNAGYGGNAGIDAARPWEFNSARDYNGHGTHTASTAGGNNGVPVTGPAAILGHVRGIAPRARIAMYKALWSTENASTSSGFNSDLVAAIDQAVADGVDVINYSISGTQTNFRDPVEIAFLYAADAGVFVAASAGNSGPTASTVAHPSPWITTVAAGTHSRNGAGSTTLGNGATYAGASFASAVPPSPLVDSVNVGLGAANPVEVELCYPGSLDPARVSGKVVLCKRGTIALVDKGAAVYAAGGVGMLLYNDPLGATNLLALFHAVPTVHLTAADGLAIKSYIAGAGLAATASIAQATIVADVPAPLTANFSSRGPLRASGDLLKPDLIAPGENILAAVAPPGNGGLSFSLYSGTSMSSPHVAGLAALLKQKNPGWTPMMIKSSLMTTGYDVIDALAATGPGNATRIFRQGAGHVLPNKAWDPGLVFDSRWNDWLGFLCGTQLPASFCTSSGIPVLDPSDFNIASIAIGDLAGAQMVKRSVTNVGDRETYTVSASVPGFAVTVSPASFTVNAGQRQNLQITITRAGAALNSYSGGFITWTGDRGHVVRIPVVARPVALGAPTAVFSAGGPITYPVLFGFDGAFTAAARGLVPAAITAGTVADDPTDGNCSLSAPNAEKIPVTIPAGTSYARFSLFDADVAPGADIDLCVVNSGGTVVGSSGSATSAEEVNLLNPAAGNYTVVVQGWGVDGSSPFKLHTWLLGTTAAGNMVVSAPATAVTGTTGVITLTFSGLTPGEKYLGSVAYGGAAGLPNPTIVRVDVP